MTTARLSASCLCILVFTFCLFLALSPALDGNASPQEQLVLPDSKSEAKEAAPQGAGYHICTDHNERTFTRGDDEVRFDQRTSDVLEPISGAIPVEPRRAWTILFYDDADFKYAYDPFANFIHDAHTTENVNVIILRDRNDREAEVWRMDQYGNTRLLAQRWGEVNMGHPTTLRRFLQFGKAHCPADRYFLAMYDHGGGWVGACTDVTNNDFLTMREIALGIADGGGVDILAFTAPCTMAAMESVYEVRDCVDVYIGSEDLSGYVDWRGAMKNICNLLHNSVGRSTEDVGRHVIEIIENNPSWTSEPVWIWSTMSAMSTSAITRVSQELDVVADYLSTHTALFLDDLEWARARTWPLGKGADYDTKSVDLYDYTLELSGRVTDPFLLQALESLRESLDGAIIADIHTSPWDSRHPYGLSLYFPRTDETYRAEYGEILDMTEDTSWNDFLLSFFHYQTAPRGDIAGTVTTDCPAPGTLFEGVTITARQISTGDLLGACVTDASGSYQINDLLAEDYVVEAFPPLGYAMAGDGIDVHLTGGTLGGVDLALVCTGESNNPRGTAYWKRAVGEAMGGGGQALLDASEICSCLDAIDAHFTSHGITVYASPAGASCSDKLAAAVDILRPLPPVKTDGSARSHLMALMLNVAAGNMRTDDVVSKDGATVAQAITYCNELLGKRAVDALVIANLINNGVIVPEGWVPLGTPQVAFTPPEKSKTGDVTVLRSGVANEAIEQSLSVSVSPNPFNPSTTISFNVPRASHVTVVVYDITGRRVATLVDRPMAGGLERVVWDGRDASGNPASTGVYFCRLTAGNRTLTNKILLLK